TGATAHPAKKAGRASAANLHRQPRTGLPPSRGNRLTTAAFENAADAPSNHPAAQPPKPRGHAEITPPRASSQIAAIRRKVRNPSQVMTLTECGQAEVDPARHVNDRQQNPEKRHDLTGPLK